MAHLRVSVAREGVNASFGTHIPHLHDQVHTIQSLTIYSTHCGLYPCSGVFAASDEDVNGWVRPLNFTT